jgi:uncharacterized hydrophobic protein (TIGR00271 family)
MPCGPTGPGANRDPSVMLHLRIITPPQVTATVLRELAEDPGVTHITVDRGAATEPPGDLVSCDVVRASVNPLLRRLRSAGVTEGGGITMTELETVISGAADRAQAQILTPEIDTIVWEEVAARTSDDSTFSVSFGVLMVLAGIIAAIAVVTNNPVLVVGAMIVSPDYGPMAALSVALLNRAYSQAWRSLRALALGFPLAALAAFLFTLATRGLGRIPAPYLGGQRPVTGLLIGANLGAFVVAFVAGAAGIVALGRAKSGAVVGVLVSITTIPAASTWGWPWPWGTRPRPAGP